MVIKREVARGPAGRVLLMDSITQLAPDDVGTVALAMLQAQDAPAVAVAHTSARIGDADDAWAHGVASHANAAARALGLQPGDRLRECVRTMIGC